MKKLLLTALILAFAGAAYAGTGVVGSKHDIPATKPAGTGVTLEAAALAQPGRNITGNRICGFCHTPHHSDNDAGNQGLPLWSKAKAAVPLAYTNYKSFTLDGDLWGDNFGDHTIGSSWLCLSCHDGSVAVDQHYNFAGNVLLTDDSWDQAGVGAGGNLMNDHPIGVDMVAAYTAEGAAGAQSGLKDPATSQFIGNALLGAFTISNYLYEGNIVTCSSCHDVHNKDSVGSEGYMLYSSVAGSNICISCHNK